MDGSFCEKNWLVVTLAAQSLEHILSETAVRIDCGLWSINCIHIAYLVQPFFVSARCCFAERIIGRGEREREIGKSRQRLERFPRIKAHSCVRIGHAVNEVRIKPVASRGFLGAAPAHAPSNERALPRITF